MMQDNARPIFSASTRIAFAIAALALLLAFASVIYTARRESIRDAAVARLMTERNVINPADVAARLRVMKLITVQITTSVRVEKKVESMILGDATVAVQTPVVVSYGTDLSSLANDGVRIDKQGDTTIIRVTIPRPTRQAVEVFADAQQTTVNKGWRRFVWWSGDDEANAAKAQIPLEARALELLPADREKIEADTREQVRRLVEALTGSQGEVIVDFK
ncbi:MAG: DUF4230 domain-containing protein [Phycisphaerae bacterium]